MRKELVVYRSIKIVQYIALLADEHEFIAMDIKVGGVCAIASSFTHLLMRNNQFIG